MKRLIEVAVIENYLYEIDGAKTDEEAKEIAKQRAESRSPLGLKDQKRRVDGAELAEDGPME